MLLRIKYMGLVAKLSAVISFLSGDLSALKLTGTKAIEKFFPVVFLLRCKRWF